MNKSDHPATHKLVNAKLDEAKKELGEKYTPEIVQLVVDYAHALAKASLIAKAMATLCKTNKMPNKAFEYVDPAIDTLADMVNDIMVAKCEVHNITKKLYDTIAQEGNDLNDKMQDFFLEESAKEDAAKAIDKAAADKEDPKIDLPDDIPEDIRGPLKAFIEAMGKNTEVKVIRM